MKTLLNQSTKPINHSIGQSVIVLQTGVPMQLDDATADAILKEWSAVLEIKEPEATEPWELKFLAGLTPVQRHEIEMAIEAGKDKQPVGPKIDDVPEPPVPTDAEGKPDPSANKFLCTLAGCAEEFTTLKKKQSHMKTAHNI